MAICDLSIENGGDEVNIQSVETERKEKKAEYLDPTDWLEKDIETVDIDIEIIKTDSTASESGYVTSDSEDSHTEHGEDESENINKDAQDVTKQERMASIFVF